MKIAYLCNSFPEPSEAYVSDEISELRHQGIEVTACSVRRPGSVTGKTLPAGILYLLPLDFWTCLHATCLCLWHAEVIRDLLWRIVRGPEPLQRRIRTLLHTWLGAYLAVQLGKRRPDHIHVHHGYFGAWVAMVAARFMHSGFSFTLHGSDLLVRADYLDVKLRAAKFCFTISEFNRDYILAKYPHVGAAKIVTQHLGVDVSFWKAHEKEKNEDQFVILSVGRLHPVKNHGFLILACHALKASGLKFKCLIAGEGQERQRLERLIACLQLEKEVQLLGHVTREQLPGLYREADVFVLTSHSEGVPVTLMEAMSTGRVVLAPKITGIPELVSHGNNGFLYRPNSMDDFIGQLQCALSLSPHLRSMRSRARKCIERNFNAEINRKEFAREFLERVQVSVNAQISAATQSNENPVLQQI